MTAARVAGWWRAVGWWSCLTALLVVAGGITLNGGVPRLDARSCDPGDACHYVRMTAGEPDVPAPFRYRVAAPWLASLLPGPPDLALAAVTYASLAACYVVVLDCGTRLGIRPAFLAFGLGLAASSVHHAYNYYNPLLTDGLGLLLVALLLRLTVHLRLLAILWVVSLGVLARESLAAFSALAAGPRRLSFTVVLALLALASVVLVRAVVGDGSLGSNYTVPERSLRELLVEPLAAWDGAWLYVALGFLLLEGPASSRVAWFAVVAAATGFATMLLATDSGRMFAVALPAVVVFAAGAQQALAAHRWLLPVSWAYVAVRAVVRLARDYDWMGARATAMLSPYADAIGYAVPAALGVAVSVLARTQLLGGLRRRWAEVRLALWECLPRLSRASRKPQ